MKSELRLGFIDTFGAIENYFTNILSERYTVIRDDVNPKYLIFGDLNFGNQNKKFDDRDVTKIFYTGENARPRDYTFHYAISFDHDEMGGRNYRLPLYAIYDYDNQRRNVPNTTTMNRMELDLANQSRGFCSFVVKNGACEKRNEWFHILNQYKHVAAGGPLFNNIGYVLPRGEESVAAKLKFLNGYKFNLCFENASYPGYATEKLYEALCAKTIPIYWGSPTIEVDFNPNAFLNWHDFKDDRLFLEAIKEVDSNSNMYKEMYMEPMFTDRYNKFLRNDLFLNWFHNNVYQG